MTKITSLPTIAGAFLAFGFAAAPAHALATATFVSGAGTDSGTCARALPCKTFNFALSQTAAGGLIVVLDPSGYGKVTITKAISILNDGVGTAGIAVSSGNAITINAGASDSVHLRGLTLDGLGVGSSGIQFTTGGNLAIENCVIRNFVNNGIFIFPSTSSSFSVSNTIASNNGNFGIVVIPTGSAVVKGVLSKVTANNNSMGIEVDGGFTTSALTEVTIVDSEASNNVRFGVRAVGVFASRFAIVSLRNVVASYNNVGLEAGDGGVLRVAHSVVTGNNTGLATSGGNKISSYGDNDIVGNISDDGLSVLLPLAMH